MRVAERAGRAALAACLAAGLCWPVGAWADDGAGDAEDGLARVVDGGVEVNEAGQAYASDQVIVVFKDGTSQSRANMALRSVESVETDAADPEAMGGALHYAVAEVADGSTVDEAIAELEADPAVEYAQPNFLYKVLDGDVTAASADGIAPQAVSTNDPLRFRQWYLGSVNAYSAWDYVKAEDSVTVAVLDTGIASDNVDLKGRIVAPRDFVGSYTDGETVAEDDFAPDDEAGHGSHVAGIIAGEADNGYGIAGVSYNARVMPLKVCFGYSDGINVQYGTSSVYLIAAYEYLLETADSDVNGDGVIGTRAQEYNVRVTNMSLGGLYSEPTNAEEQREAAKDQAFINMVERAERVNITTVCAAGNDGVNAKNWPSDWEPCVSVIALTSSDERSSFSNYGTGKDISAPGSEIFSTVSKSYYDSRGGTSIRDGEGNLNYYANMDGTSMACPVVAGVAALVCAANPSLTSAEVREILYSTAVDLGDEGWDDEFANGKVDAEAAVKAAIEKGGGSTDDPDGPDVPDVPTPGDDDEDPVVVDDPEPAPITLSLTGVAASYNWTGKAITPAPTIKWGSTVLKNGTDYSLRYQNNVNVGTAYIFVTLKGNYEGSSVVTFGIVKPTATTPTTTGQTTTVTPATPTTTTTKTTTVPAKVTATKTSISKVTGAKKAFTVKWKALSAKKASGYQVRYGTFKSMKGAKTKKVAGASKKSVTIKKLKAKKKYYVQVRTYIKSGGKTYWSAWSAKKAVKTK